MAKKPVTPRSIIKHALRLLWLHSRERQAALRRDGYECQGCHRKQSKAKGREFSVEVHHVQGIDDWELVIDVIYRRLLCPPEHLITLCKECHELEKEA